MVSDLVAPKTREEVRDTKLKGINYSHPVEQPVGYQEIGINNVIG
jgi:hypothetical protein